MEIGLTFDLRDDYRKLGYSEEAIAEFDSEETIAFIESTLQSLGYKTQRIGNIWQLTEALAAGKRWDLVFNIAEGLHGITREAQIPALLESYQVPYTFSAPEIMVVSHDKALAKLLVSHAGLATAKWQVVKNENEIADIALPYPLFVKPLAEGTGKGITARSVIATPEQLKSEVMSLLKQFDQPILVETYLSGREFTVGIAGEGKDAFVIGVMEIILKTGAEAGGHTYHNKENCEELMEYTLKNDAASQAAGILALAAWNILGCRDAGRIDIRCDAAGIPHFLEVNPLAGLHPTHSDLPILATQAGMEYSELIGKIVESAKKRIKKTKINKRLPCAS